jgi:hypothetical protein
LYVFASQAAYSEAHDPSTAFRLQAWHEGNAAEVVVVTVVVCVVAGRAVVVLVVALVAVAVDAWLVVVPAVVVPVVPRVLEVVGVVVVVVALVQRPDTHTCPAGQSAVVWHEPAAVVVVVANV